MIIDDCSRKVTTVSLSLAASDLVQSRLRTLRKRLTRVVARYARTSFSVDYWLFIPTSIL